MRFRTSKRFFPHRKKNLKFFHKASFWESDVCAYAIRCKIPSGAHVWRLLVRTYLQVRSWRGSQSGRCGDVQAVRCKMVSGALWQRIYGSRRRKPAAGAGQSSGNPLRPNWRGFPDGDTGLAIVFDQGQVKARGKDGEQFRAGFDQGYDLGFKKGYNQAIKEERQRYVRRLYENKKLSIGEVLDLTGFTKYEVDTFLN